MENLKERICSKCDTKKPIDEFGKDKHEASGHTYQCKLCRRAINAEYRKNNPEKIISDNFKRKDSRREFYQSELGVKSSRRAHLKRMFNLKLEDYDKILKKQKSVCAICKQSETSTRVKFLCVDHCHNTNEIRGLLCTTCNRAIGLLKDDIEILKKAINYLKKHKNK